MQWFWGTRIFFCMCQGGVVSDGTPVPPEDSGRSRIHHLSPWYHRRQVCVLENSNQNQYKNNNNLMLGFYLPVCRCLGPCLALCPEYSFILEDELGVCGCVLGVFDVRSFTKRCQASWIPAMRDKYPPKSGNTQVRMSRVHVRLKYFPHTPAEEKPGCHIHKLTNLPNTRNYLHKYSDLLHQLKRKWVISKWCSHMHNKKDCSYRPAEHILAWEAKPFG